MFVELNECEVIILNGGGAWEFVQALAGGIVIATAPLAGVATALVTSPSGPAAIIAGGIAYTGAVAAGLSLIDSASKK